ncbi:kunitz-type protease inhibitor 1-like [Eucyclogobius newberryi]|uniref:kunitz-type protease inhibitor 1-like n=1 Tax=Eucyclogobius newberryi TaxID=166745 RepID=UPI003B59AB27
MRLLSRLLPLLLPLVLAVRRGRAADAHCVGGHRADFVLDAEDAVKQGAVLLATEHAQSPEECERACCNLPLCNLALMEPNGACALFDCVYRNRFICNRFQSRSGYKTYVTEVLFQTYLKAPSRKGEKRQPIAVGGRDMVVQPGESVVLNGIESHAPWDQIQDYRWTLKRGISTVTMEKTQFSDQIRVSGLDSGSHWFSLTVTDSNGNSAKDEILVLVLTPEQSSLFCLAAPKVGPCRASFTRWRYDAAAQLCRNFTYGGCKGNYNNFLSATACEAACRNITVSLERRAPPPVREVCGAQCLPGQLVCDSSCCLHKSLECDGVQQCKDGADESGCSKLNQTFNRLVNIQVDQRKARCTLAPHTGPCRASFTRWFFDPLDRKCHTFTFGGCDANGNNHETKDECEDVCSGVTEEDVFAPGMFKRFEDEDESQSGSIALAVVLTVALLALLAIASYCFLKRKKSASHVPVSVTENQD